MPLTHQTPHKYRRIVIKKTGRSIHKCELPGCPHFIRSELVWNRRCLCWKCGQSFILSRAYRRTARPKCPACMGRAVPTEAIATDEASEVVEVSGGNPIKDLLDRMAKDGLEE